MKKGCMKKVQSTWDQDEWLRLIHLHVIVIVCPAFLFSVLILFRYAVRGDAVEKLLRHLGQVRVLGIRTLGEHLRCTHRR